MSRIEEIRRVIVLSNNGSIETFKALEYIDKFLELVKTDGEESTDGQVLDYLLESEPNEKS